MNEDTMMSCRLPKELKARFEETCKLFKLQKSTIIKASIQAFVDKPLEYLNHVGFKQEKRWIHDDQ